MRQPLPLEHPLHRDRGRVPGSDLSGRVDACHSHLRGPVKGESGQIIRYRLDIHRVTPSERGIGPFVAVRVDPVVDLDEQVLQSGLLGCQHHPSQGDGAARRHDDLDVVVRAAVGVLQYGPPIVLGVVTIAVRSAKQEDTQKPVSRQAHPARSDVHGGRGAREHQ